MPPRKPPPPEQTSFLDPLPATAPARSSPKDPDYRPAATLRYPPLTPQEGFITAPTTVSPPRPAPAPPPTGPDFDGQTYDPLKDYARLSTQLRDVWDRLVADPERWWTLGGLCEAILATTGRHHTEAALSARLRDLRKPKFGRHAVQRRADGGGLFRYRLDPVHYRARRQALLDRSAR